MALLGTFWDRQANATLIGPTLTTYPHSLGAAADFVMPIVKSVASASANGALYAVGGNASLNTVGVAAPSAAVAAQGAISFDLYSVIVHSIMR